MSNRKHILYVYGTLRPNNSEPVELEGTLYNLGWYPGVKIGSGNKFLAERIEVDDKRLEEFDAYEGYNPASVETSLFVRKPILDGEIYEYNGSILNRPVIESGDWFAL